MPVSNNHLLPIEMAFSFIHGIHGIHGDARKLTRVAALRRDAWVPELLEVEGVANQSSLSRFFGGGRLIAKVWASGRRAVTSGRQDQGPGRRGLGSRTSGAWSEGNDERFREALTRSGRVDNRALRCS